MPAMRVDGSQRVRRVRRTIAAGTTGGALPRSRAARIAPLCSVLVALACAGSSEAVAGGAGNGPAGAGPLVARAQRGEVAPPDVDDVEHMCALLTACERLPIPPNLIPPDFPACVKRFAEEMTSAAAINFSLTMRECGLQANSCAALRSCALHGAAPDSCSGRGRTSVVGFCDVDGRAVACWHEQPLAVRDCQRGGEQCFVAGGEAKCTLGSCPSSVKDGDKPQCSASGTHKLQCEKGKLVSLDCAAFGLRCSTTADGTAACATTAPACVGAAKRCEGTTAVECVNGHEVRVDCAGAGLACAPAPGSTPIGSCVATPPPAGACDPAERPRCDGANVKYCYAGRSRSYFCKALGFGRCDSGKSGVRCAM
jgi:hypothetical protein